MRERLTIQGVVPLHRDLISRHL
eukprot:COSAG04_NODE_29626_length_267_cov_2.220238_1_plen_22_part_01